MESDCLSSCTQYNSNCRRRCAVNSNWCVEIYLWFHQCFLKTAKAYIISFLMWFDRYLVVTILWDRVFAMIPALIIPFFFFWHMHSHVYYSVIQGTKTTPTPPLADEWVRKMLCIYTMNASSHEKGGYPAIDRNTDRLWAQYTKWDEPNKKKSVVVISLIYGT